MKRILVFLCITLLLMFNCVSTNAQELTDDGYGLIKTSVSKNTDILKNPKDIVLYIAGMETEFDNFISKNHNKTQNSKLFGIYMQNMFALRDRFFEFVTSSSDLAKYHISVAPYENSDYYRFVNPNVANVILTIEDSLVYDFAYKKMQDDYSSYLNKAWNTYLEYNIEENNDYLERITHDGEDDYYDMYMQECNKWLKKWTIFTSVHPNFPLNEQIKENLKNLEMTTQKKFNVGFYFFYMSLIGLAIIATIITVVYFIIKFNIISKTITNSKTIIKGFIKSIINHKKAILISIGVVLIISLGCFAHITLSLPSCDSKYAEETVISIFKQNDNIYQHNINNVEEIKMNNFNPISYDKNINKYVCSANLTMYSKADSPIFFVVPYNSFVYNVSYEIYKERGENKVKASWQMQNIWSQDIRR